MKFHHQHPKQTPKGKLINKIKLTNLCHYIIPIYAGINEDEMNVMDKDSSITT